MKARILDFSIGLNKKQRLTIELDGDFRTLYDALHECDVDITIKKYRQKRSKNANAYAWELIGRLAEKMDIPAVEVYRNAIRTVGIYKDFVGLDESAANTLTAAWGKLGLGWLSEPLDYDEHGETRTIRCYYGSSSYNTKQMSRLIDYIVADCKELGIETKTPDEIERMKALWKT